jgi:uncharacterized protein DUF5753/helix-turn-helix protein
VILATTHTVLPQPDRLIPRLLLGRELGRLREASGMSRKDASKAIAGSTSKISRMELGRTAFREADVAALLTCYGVHDEARRSTLLALVGPANQPAWWQPFHDLVPGWQQPYLSAEGAARLVRCFDNRFIPPLLRTEGYCREVLRFIDPGAGEEQLRRGSDLCMIRQYILRRRPRPANLWAVVSESVLYAPVESTRTLRAQLEHMVELCMRPNVTVQLLPSGLFDELQAPGSLTLVRFPQQQLSDLVSLDRPGDSAYPHRRAEVERHWHVFNRLVTESAPPDQTIPILRRAIAAL